ncbi:MAG: HDOD domain-containing protein [Acidimicrobiales bacterium]
MMRVLFVDDEPRILSAFSRMRRSQPEWEILLAPSGQEALEQAERVTLDAVVSDMRMPGMDGVALLAEMRRRHPAVARIILSGHTEQKDAMRCVSLAHQWLSKPCDPMDLAAAVRRACELQGRLHSVELREILGRVGSLPSPPSVVMKINALLDRDDVSVKELDALISTDVGMSAKVLQMVNSAFFGLGQQITHVHDAIAYLGLNLVRDLVVTSEVLSSAEGSSGLPKDIIERLRAHSVAVSVLAAGLGQRVRLNQPAFVAGLLHDIGWLVLAAQAPEHLQAIARLAQKGGALDEVEREVLGASHAEVGAYLLSMWGLPSAVVEAVAHHHDAELMAHRQLDLPHIVHVADLVAGENGDGLPELESATTPPDQGYLGQLGIVDFHSSICVGADVDRLAYDGGRPHGA